MLPYSGDLASVPTLRSWSDLRETFLSTVRSDLAPWLDPAQPYLQEQFAFALGRLDEGASLLRYFEFDNARIPAPPRDLLDIGAGSGGVAFAFANCPHYRVSAVDLGQNRVLRRVARSTGLRLRYALAGGHALPYAAESFDIVLLVDAIEHVSEPRRLGEEVIRVLRPGGLCFVMTAARAKYLFAPDPHYGVRGIAGLPNFLQRFVVNRLAGRRLVVPGEGSSLPAYDVEHLYWHAFGIARLFPGPKSVEVLFARPMAGGPLFSREWWRRKLRNLLFDHVVVYKGDQGPPRGAP